MESTSKPDNDNGQFECDIVDVEKLLTLREIGLQDENLIRAQVAVDIVSPLAPYLNRQESNAAILLVAETLIGRTKTESLLTMAMEAGLVDVQSMILAIRGKAN